MGDRANKMDVLKEVTFIFNVCFHFISIFQQQNLLKGSIN